ncbi:MAG: LamG domain-containing protein [Leptospiraceae bacterium]|nr:LamG domain-containing protein [Leptospiraceae bacterium]
MRAFIMLIIFFHLIQCSPKSSSREELFNYMILSYRDGRLTLTGTAVKGVMRNAIVNVYPVKSDGSCDTAKVLATAITNQSGEYKVTYTKTWSLVCTIFSGSADGSTLMYDEATKKDISLSSKSFSITKITRETNATDGTRSGINASPFSRMISSRLISLIKQNPKRDVSSLLTRAGREVVARFGINTGFSATRLKTSSVSEANYPELENIPMNLSNPNNDASKKFILIQAGFSKLGNRFKKSANVSTDDMQAVVKAFSDDFEDGVFDGVDSSGKQVVVGTTGIALGANAITNLLLPAMQEFLQQGGVLNLGSGTSGTISTNELASISFLDTATITSTDPSLVISSTSTAVTVTAPDPIYRWNFENNYTSTGTTALTGTATQQGAGPNVAFNGGTVKVGTASAFFGAGAGAWNNGGYIDYGTVNLGNTFSISMWVNVIAPNGSYTQKLQTLVSNKSGTTGDSNGFQLNLQAFNSETRQIGINAGNGSGSSATDVISNTNEITYNTWTHLIFTIDRTNGKAKIYKNGVSVGTTDTIRTDFTNNQTLRIGQLAGFFHYSGYIDDARLYNIVLTDAQALALFNSYN